MIDLNDVSLFVQVVRSGTFAGAARQLGMPSNTVSRRVQELEAQLGVRLFQRSTRKLTLTSAGEAFHARCAESVGKLIEAGQELLSGGQEPNGLVRVAAPADFFDFFRMDWIAEFLAALPRVRLEFLLSDAKADLIADRIDVALRGGSPEDSSYVSRPLLRHGVSRLVASPGYLSSSATPVALKDLARHDCISFPNASGAVTWRLFGPEGLEESVELTPRFSGNTAQALRKAAVAGLGIALLPETLVQFDLDAGLLIPVMPHLQRGSLGLHALYPSRQHLPAAVKAFVEMARDRLVGTYESHGASA